MLLVSLNNESSVSPDAYITQELIVSSVIVPETVLNTQRVCEVEALENVHWSKLTFVIVLKLPRDSDTFRTQSVNTRF